MKLAAEFLRRENAPPALAAHADSQVPQAKLDKDNLSSAPPTLPEN